MNSDLPNVAAALRETTLNVASLRHHIENTETFLNISKRDLHAVTQERLVLEKLLERARKAESEKSSTVKHFDTELEKARQRESDACIPWAQASCRALVDMMDRKLPNELKFMVYDELFRSTYDYSKAPYLFEVYIRYSYGMNIGYEGFKVQRPHFLDPLYVGREVAAQLAGRALKAMFSSEEVEDPSSGLMYFLTSDPLQLGVSPTPYLTDVYIEWMWRSKPYNISRYKSDIEAIQLLKPRNEFSAGGLQVVFAIEHAHSEDTLDEIRPLLDLFKPAHKHLTRHYRKEEFEQYKTNRRAGVSYDLPSVRHPGIPYIIYLNDFEAEEIGEVDLFPYFWAVSTEEEEKAWKDICRQWEAVGDAMSDVD